ncbi:CoA ester lyase [Corticibacter populi]|uniref:CoA ester lyase n=1 Tax=Corticibacter populi TaxID=1550736 RepID=A0A3M6QU00_9BURK|nr:CoA ester lyase [Corticibacter populi]RMX06500.1 CoA ester lyase [Corticibacter populi]RZS31940.1 citrate lyase subunit beta/citryl-CoA lyase [Corticibacter populi]
MRSKLFVPGDRPELFEKAYRSEADAISLDLEDAVAPARKAQARENVRQWLAQWRQMPERHAGKITIVRINAPGSDWFEQDLDAMVQPGVDMINLPKPTDAASVAAIAETIRKLERARGLTTPVRLLLNIETPAALRNAASLACAAPCVAGLQLGLADLFEPNGIDRSERLALAQVLLQVRLAASEAGVDAYDGAFADIRNPAGFEEEAALARRLGFAGKTCIHPSQVALANAAFQPTTAQIESAQKVLLAAQQAQLQGNGVYVVDGKMVDAPFVARAQATVTLAQRLGLLT